MNTNLTLVRIEGVNLDHFVFDTRDLSTIRGGSFMLLDAVDDVLDHLTKLKVLEKCLSRGASSGLFTIHAECPETVVSGIRKLLAGRYPHATFVVDAVPRIGNFRDDLETAIAANRKRQMQAFSFAVPERSAVVQDVTDPACEMDGLRPALKLNKGPTRDNGEPTYLSAATLSRREYGRKAKNDFYGKMIRRRGGPNADLAERLPEFAEDFKTIASGTASLSGKLAVFYADGNSFGRTQSNHCGSPEKQEAWDTFIRGSREEFLIKFLEDEITGPAKENPWLDAKGRARFETLLWGGDEFMFVVPAALGWRFATLFFRHFGGMNLAQAGGGLPQSLLTHAAALVFCQHHAPIDRIKHLAKDQMVEDAKAMSRDLDSLSVVVLESFDHLGNSYATAMARRYASSIGLDQMVLKTPQDGSLHKTLETIARCVEHLHSPKSHFARSQLRGTVNAILAAARGGGPPLPPGKAASAAASAAAFEEVRKAAFKNATEEDIRILQDNLKPCFPSDTALWLQLEELWDYAKP